MRPSGLVLSHSDWSERGMVDKASKWPSWAGLRGGGRLPRVFLCRRLMGTDCPQGPPLEGTENVGWAWGELKYDVLVTPASANPRGALTLDRPPEDSQTEAGVWTTAWTCGWMSASPERGLNLGEAAPLGKGDSWGGTWLPFLTEPAPGICRYVVTTARLPIAQTCAVCPVGGAPPGPCQSLPGTLPAGRVVGQRTAALTTPASHLPGVHPYGQVPHLEGCPGPSSRGVCTPAHHKAHPCLPQSTRRHPGCHFFCPTSC